MEILHIMMVQKTSDGQLFIQLVPCTYEKDGGESGRISIEDITDTAIIISDAYVVASCNDHLYPYFEIEDRGNPTAGEEGFQLQYSVGWSMPMDNIYK